MENHVSLQTSAQHDTHHLRSATTGRSKSTASVFCHQGGEVNPTMEAAILVKIIQPTKVCLNILLAETLNQN